MIGVFMRGPRGVALHKITTLNKVRGFTNDLGQLGLLPPCCLFEVHISGRPYLP
jgi:hypothetical protein